MTAAMQDAEGTKRIPPSGLLLRINAETAPLYHALADATTLDGVDMINRVRGLLAVWAMDPAAPDAPAWLAELHELVRAEGSQFAQQVRAAGYARRAESRRGRRQGHPT